MIQANELRKGNIINNGFKAVKVEGIDAEGILLRMNCISMSSDMLTGRQEREYERLYLAYELAYPILLTPEILEKCGFVKSPLDSIGDLELDMPDNNELEYSYSDGLITFNGMYFPMAPRSLHQLQNLYFALTGEELEVKL